MHEVVAAIVENGLNYSGIETDFETTPMSGTFCFVQCTSRKESAQLQPEHKRVHQHDLHSWNNVIFTGEIDSETTLAINS